MPDREVDYYALSRVPGMRWWQPLLVIVLFGSLWIAATVVLTLPAMAYGMVTGEFDPTQPPEQQMATPAFFLVNNLSLAAFIPLAMLCHWLVFKQRPGLLSSVTGRFRWKWALVTLGITLPIWLVYMGSSFLLEPQAAGARRDTAVMLLIVLLTQPLQSAGEEYAMRGVLPRVLSAWFGNRTVGMAVGVVVSSVVFAALHGSTDVWLWTFYLLFALTATWLTWRTGGLEAACVLHTVNNVLSFVVVIWLGQLDQVFAREAGSGSPWGLVYVPFAVAVCAAVAWAHRRTGQQRLWRPANPTAPQLTP